MAKILIIDDKEDNLITISALLKNLLPGCEIITAQSGEEGIKKTRLENPDTILLDIIMPGMDGFEVCKIIKSSPETKHIPLIFLTAIRTDSKSRVRGLELGADAFLNKPVDEMELAAQIKVALRMKYAEDLLRKEKELLEEKVRERTKDLIESEKRYRTLFDSSTDAVFIHDCQGRFIEVNKVACERIGYTKEEFSHMSVSDIVSPEYVRFVTERLAEINRKGYLFFETVHICRNKNTIPVEVNTHIIDLSGQKVTLSIVRDIRERKKTEEEKEKLQKQLYQAQKMKAIGTLAGGIAHDFNNILAGIMGYTELILDSMPANSANSEHLNHILKAVKRAKDLVRQILAFSRESGEIEKKPVKISLIVKEALKLIRATIPSTIEIRQNIEYNSSIVLAEPTQIHQVIINLCTNASHAMKEKGGILEVNMENIEIKEEEGLKDGSYVKLSVSDTGHGIDKTVMERIFEPYFTTKEPGEGAGLGLSVVHGIVKRHGGDIKVYSEKGKGTVFHIYLPRIKTDVKEEDKSSEHIPEGQERILFVDDEEELSFVASHLLEKLGYKVTVKTSSIEALEIFKKDPQEFDLIITDQTMPKMTGIELVKEIISIRPDMPVILCTGFSEIINEKNSREMGIRKFIMKPFVRKDMAEAIRAVIGDR